VLGPTQAAFRDGLYVDRLYLRALVRPVRDRVAAVTAAFDRVVVDGAVRATGSGVDESGRVVRLLHTGNVQLYMSVLVVGALVIAIGATAL
jgi:NADH-quinone oxidoreductase subunit L